MKLEEAVKNEPISELFKKLRKGSYDGAIYFDDAVGAIPPSEGFGLPPDAHKRLSDSEARVIGIYGNAEGIMQKIRAYFHQVKNFFAGRVLGNKVEESLLEEIARNQRELRYANAEIIPLMKRSQKVRDVLEEQNRGLWLNMGEMVKKREVGENSYRRLEDEIHAIEKDSDESSPSDKIRARMETESLGYKKRKAEKDLAYCGRQTEFSENAIKANGATICMLEDYISASEEVLNLSQLAAHQLNVAADWIRIGVLLPRAGRLLEEKEKAAEGVLNKLYNTMTRVAEENSDFVGRQRSFAVYHDNTLESFKAAVAYNRKNRSSAHQASYLTGNHVLEEL